MIRAADPATRPQVLEILDSAQDLGLKVLRMWAFDEGPMQYNTLQRYPGQAPSIPGRYGMFIIWAWACLIYMVIRLWRLFAASHIQAPFCTCSAMPQSSGQDWLIFLVVIVFLHIRHWCRGV